MVNIWDYDNYRNVLQQLKRVNLYDNVHMPRYTILLHIVLLIGTVVNLAKTH